MTDFSVRYAINPYPVCIGIINATVTPLKEACSVVFGEYRCNHLVDVGLVKLEPVIDNLEIRGQRQMGLRLIIGDGAGI